MSEDEKFAPNRKSKTPVLLPEKERIVIPEGHKKPRPPYILIFIVVFAVLGAFWKVYMVSKNAEKGSSSAAPVSAPQ